MANGIIDTFIHTVEQYVTYPAEGRFQDRTAEGILQTLIEVGPKTLAEPEDYDARANLMWCATMALKYHIDHGKTACDKVVNREPGAEKLEWNSFPIPGSWFPAHQFSDRVIDHTPA